MVSAITELSTTVNDFTKCLNQKGQCNVLFLDFSKAFDKVPLHIPFSVLSSNIMALIIVDQVFFNLYIPVRSVRR